MSRPAFQRGVDDARAGKLPDYDQFTFDQSSDEEFVQEQINGCWDYERGRQWARIAPMSMSLRIDGELNPKAVRLYDAASDKGYVI